MLVLLIILMAFNNSKKGISKTVTSTHLHPQSKQSSPQKQPEINIVDYVKEVEVTINMNDKEGDGVGSECNDERIQERDRAAQE